jgi:hypothetical protein
MATGTKVVTGVTSDAFRTRVAIAGVTVANTVMGEGAVPFASARKALAAEVVRNVNGFAPLFAIVCGAFPAIQTAMEGAANGQEAFGPTDANLQSAISTAWNTLAGVS